MTNVLVILFIYFRCQQTFCNEDDRSELSSSKLEPDTATSSDGNVDEIVQFKQLLEPILRVRVSGTEANLIVQRYISDQMKNLGWHVDEDWFVDQTPLGQKEFTNIIATFNPNAAERLVMACHYDSKKIDRFEFVGATDSAASCAILIDLARRLNDSLWTSTETNDPESTLQLIFFDGEEAFVEWSETDSLYGSRHLAEKLQKQNLHPPRSSTATTSERGGGGGGGRGAAAAPAAETSRTSTSAVVASQLDAIKLFVLLDLIGTQRTQFFNWFPATADEYWKLQNIERTMAVNGELWLTSPTRDRISTLNRYFPDRYRPRYGGMGIPDDHIPFIKKDVPVLHLISYPFPGVWHTANDTEEALHYPTIINLARILHNYTAEYLKL